MEFRVEPGFVHRAEEPRYFVCSINMDHRGWLCGYRWQIQLLNEDGEGLAFVMFGPDDGTDFVNYLAVSIPLPVVEAARSGVSDYVDEQGQHRDPFYMGR